MFLLDFSVMIPPIRKAAECVGTRKGLRHQLKPQFTNTLDFWKHKTVPHPLHMGVGLCYNQLNNLNLSNRFAPHQSLPCAKGGGTAKP